MDFLDQMRKTFNQGLNVSRDLLEKAADKAKELGDIGVLKFEIMQLENQAEKLLGQLGSFVYEQFAVQGHKSITEKNSELHEIIEQIEEKRKLIEAKKVKIEEVKAQEKESGEKVDISEGEDD